MLTRSPRSVLSLWCLAGALAVFAAEPEAGGTARPAPLPVSPFGIGSCHARSLDHSKWMPQMTAIGLRDLRSFQAGWGTVQPAAETWNWGAVDRALDYLESQQVATGALLIGGGPPWIKSPGPRGLPLANLPEWSAYVSALVGHTKGRVQYFEVWNEPPNGTRNASPADYAKLVVASYDAAKAANPEAKVGLAAKSVYLYYLDAALKAGAKGHYDYITLHPYEVLGAVAAHPGTEPLYLTIAAKTRKMLAAQDPDKVNVPIFFTEIGWNASHKSGGSSGPDMQAQALVKAYTMGIAQGIACVQWFEGMDGDSGPMGLLDARGTPRPAYTALAQLVQHLGKYPDYLGWLLLNDKHYAFLFQGAQGQVLATWAATATPDAVDFGQTVTIIDPPTGKATQAAQISLTTAPILVLNVPERLAAQAKANKERPFTWGGDYSAAKSVSVALGEKKTERGLHTMAADTIAADVVAYGGNARVGTVPGGNVFMVDPNFLSYTTVPIEITAVVRRNEKNDPAKLILEYESTSGYRKLPPYEVPDNQEWHTATWKIDDAQFVASWAFDFRFNAGPYCLQSVTVTRGDR